MTSTAHPQQWDIMEERNIKHINIGEKMIKYITHFISVLISKKKRTFIPGSSDIAALTSHPQILDLIAARHGVDLEPPRHKRGSKRINFVFCTQLIDQYIQRCEIFPFDTLSPSDHRAIYIALKYSFS